MQLIAKNESYLAILVLLLCLRISGEWGYLGVERGGGGDGGGFIASSYLFFRALFSALRSDYLNAWKRLGLTLGTCAISSRG